MLLGRKLKAAIAYKVSKLLTHLVVELVQVWVPYLSQKSEKNIKTESLKPSRSSLHPKFLILSLNLTMLLYLFTCSLTLLTRLWSLITKHSMISASEHSNLQLPPMEI